MLPGSLCVTHLTPQCHYNHNEVDEDRKPLLTVKICPVKDSATCLLNTHTQTHTQVLNSLECFQSRQREEQETERVQGREDMDISEE